MIQIDMKKPDHCLRCPMRGVDDECVLIRGSENFFGWEEQYANCPLQEVEPERKKGKWIFIHPLQADDEGAYICSNCRHGDWDIKPTDKYCKFCGADMRGGEEDGKIS